MPELRVVDDTRLEGVNPAPLCQAILLCDEVTRDEASGKTTVVGIFDTFYVPSFPGATVPCKVFLLLTGMAGNYNLVAEIHDPMRGLVLFRSRNRVEFVAVQNQTKREICLPVSPLAFDRSGSYELVVFADENEVGRLEFSVQTFGALSDVSGQHPRS